MFTESVIGKQQEFPHKNEITSPFTPKFHPKKLETIDEYTKLIFKKHLDNLKNKKRDVLIYFLIFYVIILSIFLDQK